MGKNIVIFSDGTGQRSGISFDERRSNIYKLYRACRCGPDSSIDPADQVAFYDPGVGTAPPGSWLFRETFARIKNLVCMATGWGLTTNVIDCYAAIIRLWRPGDRIYLFGFSRGAYTVRLLGGVLSHCGVPTMNGPDHLPRSESAIRKIAKEGVTEVYQHTASERLEDYFEQMERENSPKVAHRKYLKKSDKLKQRDILAARYRIWYGSEVLTKNLSENKSRTDLIGNLLESTNKEEIIGNIDGFSNVVPYFIGAFDTVSSMFHAKTLAGLILIYSVVLIVISYLLTLTPFSAWELIGRWVEHSPETLEWRADGIVNFLSLATLSTLALIGWTLWSHVRFPGELRYGQNGRTFSSWETLTFYTRMVFGDRFLSRRVPYARHAIAVDELRDMFDLVHWEHEGKGIDPTNDLDSEERTNATLRQMCFAGSHTDIGGGYPEDESRLSDIALEWMAKEAKSVGLQVDGSYFHLWPDPVAIQHDEMEKWLNRRLYNAIARARLEDVELHSTLEQRVRASNVLYSDREDVYRPEALRTHALYKSWLPKASEM